MSSAIFGVEYAAAYDALYQDKDYLTECDVVERVFQVYGQGPVRRVLDLGCGTGGHAVVLAARGYEVVGVDRSPHMVERARARGSRARFEVGEIAGVDLGETFDAVLMMFAVLGYQTGNLDVQAALATARRHLQPGGLLFCDMWYGPAVLSQRPGDRVKVAETDGGEVIRIASSELDPRHHMCLVRYRMWQVEAGRITAETNEQHRMRYFFPLELELFLGASGFEERRLGGFPDIDVEPGEATWNVSLVARAV